MGLGLDHTERLLRDIAAVEADDLARVAAKYLVNPVTVILRPGKAARTQL